MLANSHSRLKTTHCFVGYHTWRTCTFQRMYLYIRRWMQLVGGLGGSTLPMGLPCRGETMALMNTSQFNHPIVWRLSSCERLCERWWFVHQRTQQNKIYKRDLWSDSWIKYNNNTKYFQWFVWCHYSKTLKLDKVSESLSSFHCASKHQQIFPQVGHLDMLLFGLFSFFFCLWNQVPETH